MEELLRQILSRLDGLDRMETAGQATAAEGVRVGRTVDRVMARMDLADQPKKAKKDR